MTKANTNLTSNIMADAILKGSGQKNHYNHLNNIDLERVLLKMPGVTRSLNDESLYRLSASQWERVIIKHPYLLSQCPPEILSTKQWANILSNENISNNFVMSLLGEKEHLQILHNFTFRDWNQLLASKPGQYSEYFDWADGARHLYNPGKILGSSTDAFALFIEHHSLASLSDNEIIEIIGLNPNLIKYLHEEIANNESLRARFENLASANLCHALLLNPELRHDPLFHINNLNLKALINVATKTKNEDLCEQIIIRLMHLDRADFLWAQPHTWSQIIDNHRSLKDYYYILRDRPDIKGIYPDADINAEVTILKNKPELINAMVNYVEGYGLEHWSALLDSQPHIAYFLQAENYNPNLLPNIGLMIAKHPEITEAFGFDFIKDISFNDKCKLLGADVSYAKYCDLGEFDNPNNESRLATLIATQPKLLNNPQIKQILPQGLDSFRQEKNKALVLSKHPHLIKNTSKLDIKEMSSAFSILLENPHLIASINFNELQNNISAMQISDLISKKPELFDHIPKELTSLVDGFYLATALYRSPELISKFNYDNFVKLSAPELTNLALGRPDLAKNNPDLVQAIIDKTSEKSLLGICEIYADLYNVIHSEQSRPASTLKMR